MNTTHPADDLAAMLHTGAVVADSRYQSAAIHLLTFTDLPGRADFAAHVETSTVTIDGREVPAAWVDWAALGRGEYHGYLNGGQERLLKLAVSMARGVPVDLRATLNSLGREHSRQVMEAVAICLELD